MNPIILFRNYCKEDTAEELFICRQYFDVTSYRSEIESGHLVIGRYSVLPYYEEVEQDVHNCNSTLINSHKQHSWIADFRYYDVLKDYTPETWFSHNFQYCTFDGPFIVKGATNSKKFYWDRLMFAKNKREALRIGCDLNEDSYLGIQDIIYRRYVPLKTFEIGINGLPFTNEWRLFCFRDKILAHGYYWACADKTDYVLDDKGLKFAEKLCSIVSQHVNFYVLDIAETADGEWILIEVNDGQMSGLSMVDPHTLYSKLKEEVQDAINRPNTLR